MAEEISKHSEIREMQAENELLRNCMNRFPELQQKVECAQMMTVHGKYQYFLRKFKKITEEHLKYKEIYQNIEKSIEESLQIKEENRSIEFIKKVMQETERKYFKLKDNIDSLKAEKQQNQNEIRRLKNILLNMKGEYFALERKEEELGQRKMHEEIEIKQKENIKNMFKIRRDKRTQVKQSSIIKPTLVIRNITDQSFAENKIMQELEVINKIKEEFLENIGTNINEFHQNQEKMLEEQSRANKLISKKTFKLQDKKFKSVGSYEPEANVLEVFRIVKNYDEELEEFLNLSPQEILETIVSKNKVKDVLQLIEEEKRGLIQAYSRTKYERLRVQ